MDADDDLRNAHDELVSSCLDFLAARHGCWRNLPESTPRLIVLWMYGFQAEARLELTPTSSLANIASALGTESKTTADRIGCSHGLQQFVIHKADIDQLHKVCCYYGDVKSHMSVWGVRRGDVHASFVQVKRIPDDLQIVVEYTRGTESLNQLGAIPEEDSNITVRFQVIASKPVLTFAAIQPH